MCFVTYEACPDFKLPPILAEQEVSHRACCVLLQTMPFAVACQITTCSVVATSGEIAAGARELLLSARHHCQPFLSPPPFNQQASHLTHQDGKSPFRNGSTMCRLSEKCAMTSRHQLMLHFCRGRKEQIVWSGYMWGLRYSDAVHGQLMN